MIKIGTRVKVNLRDVATGNEYLRNRLLHGEIVPYAKGTVKRIASNGAIGVEFSFRVTKSNMDRHTTKNVYNLHGECQTGYGLYFRPEDVSIVEPIFQVHGEVAQAMIDDMLDQEYGMSDDDYNDIIGF